MLLTHGDSVDHVAEGFKSVAKSGDLVAAIANEKDHIYGLQFHPEVSCQAIDTHGICNDECFHLCNLADSWRPCSNCPCLNFSYLKFIKMFSG